MMSHDVFISYSSKQKSIGDGVCHYLESHGCKCWMAPRDIPPGSDYGDLIEEAILQAKVVVLVYSENSFLSQWVRGEINTAFSEGKPIVPFRVDEMLIKGGFKIMLNRVHWIDAFPEYADKLPDLLKSVLNLLDRPTEFKAAENEVTNVETASSSVQVHNLKIRTNVDCVCYVDGEEKMKLSANKRIIIPLPFGEYELTFVNVENHDVVMHELEIEMPAHDKVLDVNILFDEDKFDLLFDSGQYPNAFDYVFPFAMAGYASAQNNLGNMYYWGYGVERDYAEALRWYRKSADQGDATAQNNLGKMYYWGDGVKKDYAEAVRWYKKSADQGKDSAQYNLGFMYKNGYGVEKDAAEAVRWYRKSAEQGCASAQYNLGNMYYWGYGVEKDYAEAVKWYKKSAGQGCASAQNSLGDMYYYGYGVEKDAAEAVRWFRKSAEQGCASAQYNLGNMYYWGYGVEKDYAEAVKWYRKSAEQGDADARCSLGFMYRNGYGVEKSKTEALYWYAKAAAQGYEDAKDAIRELRKIRQSQ